MSLRPGIDSTWTAALAANGIHSALLARMEFASGTVFVSTLTHALIPTGTGDTLLDGNQFEPIASGMPVTMGDNTYSYSGSEALAISLSIPAGATNEELLSAADPSEYQTRLCVVWRALMITPANATTAAAWSFKRVRAGSMDELSITNDGSKHEFTLTIEAHAALISSATGSTYNDQKTRFDANDTSQDFAVAIATNKGHPTSSTLGGGAGGGGVDGGGGGGGGGFGGQNGMNLTVWN